MVALGSEDRARVQGVVLLFGVRVFPLVTVSLLMMTGCVIGKHEVKVRNGDDAVILLASVTMPEPIDTIARHAWFAVREEGSEKWRKIEYGGFGPGPLKNRSWRCRCPRDLARC